MERLIEEQAVIECLTNTAKYYEREDADEWTKGILYGLLHGVDNILDDVPTVEAIPKADYENRLKADMAAMLTEIQVEIEELQGKYSPYYDEASQHTSEVIRQKIRGLEGNQ